MTTPPTDPLLTVGEYPLERGDPTCPSCGAMPHTVHLYSEIVSGRECRTWTWECSCGANVKLNADRWAPRLPDRITDKMTGVWDGLDVTVARGLHSLEEMRKLAE